MRIRTRAFTAAVAAAMLVSAHGSAAVPPPPRPIPTPLLSYDGPAGFSAMWRGRIISVSRQGTRHWDDPTGRISLYDFINQQMQWPPEVLRDTPLDDRNAAGGVTKSGALVYFYARQNSEDRSWADMWMQRIGPDDAVSNFRIPTADDWGFSPYGPLVQLPSGALMQTMYGRGVKGHRTWVMFSYDDGLTWKRARTIEHSKGSMPTETAAAYVDGATDSRTRLIAMTRTARMIRGTWVSYLQQTISTDGGWSWRHAGYIGTNQEVGAIPWIANIGGGRLALVTVVRDPKNMVINASIANAKDVFNDPSKWPAFRPIYRSTLQREPIRVEEFGESWNYSDFGYPSIVRTGPTDADLFVVFSDSRTGNSGYRPTDAASDVDLIMRPLFGPAV